MDTNPVNQQKGPNFRAVIIDKKCYWHDTRSWL